MRKLLGAGNYKLQEIIEKAVVLTTVNERVQQFLDPTVQAYTTVTNLRNGTLVLATENAAIATRLKYASPDLLSLLRTKGNMPDLRAIKVVVQTKGQGNRPRQTVPAPKPLTNNTKSLLEQQASTTKNKNLQAILAKLAK